MTDMAEDVNLVWDCSRTRCCGGYLKLRETILKRSCRKLHSGVRQDSRLSREIITSMRKQLADEHEACVEKVRGKKEIQNLRRIT